MIHLKFTIYDTKAEAYLPPFILPTRAMAIRIFTDCCNDDGHAFGKHPHDYTLFQCGTFDDNTAHEVLKLEAIGNGVEYVENELHAEEEKEMKHFTETGKIK